MENGYTIKIQQFEGPFDLLLFFIERDELDIYDIPIAKITDDFLEYIRQLESLNIDVASEFILVAATLMRIKARLLIPRRQIDEEGNEIDPREELVQKLIEYKRFKSIIGDMSDLEQIRDKKHERGNIQGELKVIANKALVDLELESLTLYKLMNAFSACMERLEEEKNKVIHAIVNYPYTIGTEQVQIINKINSSDRPSFSDIFGGLDNRIHAIVTFLALLELLNTQTIEMISGEGVNNFWLKTTIKEFKTEEEE